MTFTVAGSKLRLHFNRHGAAPLVWCVSTGDFEIAVKSFRTSGVSIEASGLVRWVKDDTSDTDGGLS